jgi:hypothetical protein
MNMDTKTAELKKRKIEMILSNEKEFAKGLIKRGASLHKTKKVILANLEIEDSGVLAVFHVKFGGVGAKMYLLPKEMDGVTAIYNGSGEVVKLGNENVELLDSQFKAVVMSWNAYKKNDATMAFLGKDQKVTCTFPRIRAEEVEAEVNFKGEKKEVRSWRVSTLVSSGVHYTDPKTLLGFLKLGVVGVESFVRVANAVEDAVKAGGFEQFGAEEFNDIVKLATICSDTSLFKEKRDLAGLIMGLVQQGEDMDVKIEGFKTAPSVTFATACKFLQVHSAKFLNVSTKTDVKAVALESLDDEDMVVMTRVPINVAYWNKLTDFSAIMVYKEAGNLAIKKQGKKQTTAQKFDVEKAEYVKAIHKIIVAHNTAIVPTGPASKSDDGNEIDDELFD